MALMSAITAIHSCWNLLRTPKSELVRSGSFISWSLREFPLGFAEQSKTTQIFAGLLWVVNSVVGDEPFLAFIPCRPLVIGYSLGIPFDDNVMYEDLVVIMKCWVLL